jgi:hypothetical protein
LDIPKINRYQNFFGEQAKMEGFRGGNFSPASRGGFLPAAAGGGQYRSGIFNKIGSNFS